VGHVGDSVVPGTAGLVGVGGTGDGGIRSCWAGNWGGGGIRPVTAGVAVMHTGWAGVVCIPTG
jgi:hypothetical protein